ncbi:hypothetical protein Ancab_021523 [Ancistrocladus abbreviatus]
MEKKHHCHSHTLLEVECTAELCAGCRSDINGLAFGCMGCRFFLHKLCANLPRTLRDPLSSGRADWFELQLFRSGPGDDYFHCRDCHHRIYKQGFVYVRQNKAGQVKAYKLHVDCALLRHPYHVHLYCPVYFNIRSSFPSECPECGAKFHENEYEGFNLVGCVDCRNTFHRECLEPALVKRMVKGAHNVTDCLDPVPWNFNEWDHYFCDGCKEYYQERVDPTKERLQHFSHRHPLVELEHTSHVCSGCGSTIDGPSFGIGTLKIHLIVLSIANSVIAGLINTNNVSHTSATEGVVAMNAWASHCTPNVLY